MAGACLTHWGNGKEAGVAERGRLTGEQVREVSGDGREQGGRQVFVRTLTSTLSKTGSHWKVLDGEME